MLEQKRYRAFISYSQQDVRWARKLHKALENYRVPLGVVGNVNLNTRKLGRVFRDDDEMGASESLGRTLEAALDDSETLIVLCSPNSAKSKWVDMEVKRFKRNPDARVFAVIIDGSPNTGDPTTECFCPALRFKVDSSGKLSNTPDEPLAPDWRKDGLTRLRVKLGAGILGVNFDELWRRDQRQRNTDRLKILAASIVVLSLIGTFSVVNVRQQNSELSKQLAAAAVQSVRDQISPQIEDNQGSNAERGLRLAVLAAKESALKPLTNEAQDALQSSFFHLKPVIPIVGIDSAILQTVFNPVESEFALIRTKNNTVQYWSLLEAKQLWEVVANSSVNTPIKLSLSINSRGNRTLVSTLTDFSYGGPTNRSNQAIDYGQLTVVSTNDGLQIGTIELGDRAIYEAFLSNDGSEVYAVSMAGEVFVWHLESGQIVRQVNAASQLAQDSKPTSLKTDQPVVWSLDYNSTVSELAINLSGQIVLVRMEDLQARPLFPNNSSHQVDWGRFTPDGKTYMLQGSYGFPFLVDTHTGEKLTEYISTACWRAKNLSFNVSGTVFALSCPGRTEVSLYLTKTGDLYKSFDGHAAGINTVHFAKDGNRSLTASWDGTARLWNMQLPTPTEVARFEGHNGAVLDAKISDDGKFALTTGEDGSVRLWPLEHLDGKALRETKKTNYESVTFSPDGEVLAANTELDGIQVLESRSGEVKTLFDGHKWNVNAFQFSPSGESIISSSADGSVRIWSPLTGKELHKPIAVQHDYRNRINTVKIMEAGDKVLSGSNRAIKLWQLENNPTPINLLGEGVDKNIGKLDHLSEINRMAVSSTRTQNAVSTSSVELWQAEPAKFIATIFSGFYNIPFIKFSPDGRYLISSDIAANTYIYNAESGAPLEQIPANGPGPNEFYFSEDASHVAISFPRSLNTQKPKLIVSNTLNNKIVSEVNLENLLTHFIISKDNRALITGTNIGELVSWSTNGGERKLDYKGHNLAITSIKESNDQSKLISASIDKTVRIWNASSGKKISTYSGHQHSISFASFTENDSSAISVDIEGTVCKWSAQTADEHYCRTLGPGTEEHVTQDLDSETPLIPAKVTAVDFDEVRGRLVVANDNGQITVWNTADGSILQSLTDSSTLVKPRTIKSTALTGSGTKLAVVGANPIHGIWDYRTGKINQTPSSSHQQTTSLALSPDEQAFVFATLDGLYLKKDEIETKLPWSGSAIRTIEFASSSNIFTTLSESGELAVWDADSATLAFSASGPESNDVAISSSGNNIYSAGKDGVIRRWNAKSNEVDKSYIGHRGEVSWIKLYESAGVLLSSGRDYTARLWAIESETPLASASLPGSSIEQAADYHPGQGLFAVSGGGTINIHQLEPINTDLASKLRTQTLLDDICAANNSLFPNPLRLITAGDAEIVSVLESRIGQDVCSSD